jgi:hypothetical protein
MTKEALNMALKALQFSGNIWHMDCKKDEAITAIKEALAQPEQERNFCARCGKRTADLTVIHTCTPPQENNN